MIPTTAIEVTQIPEISRGAIEIAREGLLIEQCNAALANTFTIGLFLGALVGMAGLYLGMAGLYLGMTWYRGRQG